jgi:tRNA pseudouridine55 synthase
VTTAGATVVAPTRVVDGVLVVAKPPGPTSHDVVAIVRRLTGARRVGHGGTLDPFAAGVLPVFLGIATRMVEYHLADQKAYRAVVVLGARSTTDDRDGELIPIEGVPPGRNEVVDALASFEGEIEQVPPSHSAVRVSGRRAYELARHGQQPELRPRTVRIHQITLTDWDERDPARPAATLEVRCSAGTYIRAIARDLGAKLGNGAYLGALTRTASGPFRLESAIPLDEVRAALVSGTIERLLLPPDTGLDAFPCIRLDAAELGALAHGQVIRHRGERLPAPGPEGLFRILADDGRLVAMARLEAGRLHPEKVFITPAV